MLPSKNKVIIIIIFIIINIHKLSLTKKKFIKKCSYLVQKSKPCFCLLTIPPMDVTLNKAKTQFSQSKYNVMMKCLCLKRSEIFIQKEQYTHRVSFGYFLFKHFLAVSNVKHRWLQSSPNLKLWR